MRINISRMETSIYDRNLNGIHETVKYKENSNVKLFINVEVEDYPIHWHTPMEIIMPLEGSYTVQIGDDLVHLNESDIIFIASGVKHRLIAPDTGKGLSCRLSGLLSQNKGIKFHTYPYSTCYNANPGNFR